MHMHIIMHMQINKCICKYVCANKQMYMHIFKWICILWNACAYNPCISHAVQYCQRMLLPRSKSESINSVQETHSNIINQPVRTPTTQLSIVSSDGVSKKFAVNLVRVMSGGIARVGERITNAFEDEPHACITTSSFSQSPLRVCNHESVTHTHSRGIQWARAKRRCSNTRTREHDRTTSPIPGKPTTPSRTTVSWSGWPILLSKQKKKKLGRLSQGWC